MSGRRLLTNPTVNVANQADQQQRQWKGPKFIFNDDHHHQQCQSYGRDSQERQLSMSHLLCPPAPKALRMHAQIASPEFSDWIGLLALLRESFGYMEGRIDPPSSLSSMTEHDLQAKAGRECLIVAYDTGQLVGCAYAEVRAHCVYVGKVAVAAGHRGRGVAREIMAVAEHVAISAGHQVLELQTRVELLENHRAFAALGFEKVTETAHRGYTRPTSITMRRRLVPDRNPRWDC